jgi:hypothetical protein
MNGSEHGNSSISDDIRIADADIAVREGNSACVA